jgi:hypothetical protein
MKIILAVLILAGSAFAAEPAYDWQQTDRSLALTRGGKIVWQFNYPKEGKPHFHPLTVGGGATLTALNPPDHVWHHALWFSWKYLNKVNYWEEDKKTGVAQGRTEVVAIDVARRDNHEARFKISLAYHPPGKPNVLTEERVVEVGAPDKDGGYLIDWVATFTAGDAPVELERTKPYVGKDGVKHGGYAGLSVRMTPDAKNWKYFDSDNRVIEKDSGFPAKWFAATGALPDKTAATVAILEDAGSFRHPTPWYAVKNMPFWQPAVIFAEPHTIPANGKTSLRYRILVRNGETDAAALQSAWSEFSRK